MGAWVLRDILFIASFPQLGCVQDKVTTFNKNVGLWQRFINSKDIHAYHISSLNAPAILNCYISTMKCFMSVKMFLPKSLKGKFSSGTEGALASTLNRDFNWKQLSEMILCILLLMFTKFIWVSLIQKQQKKKQTRDWILGVGAALY